jgi:GTPase SAR1 family protein
MSTVGVGCVNINFYNYKKESKVLKIGKNTIKLTLVLFIFKTIKWDTAGQERFRSIT